MNERDGGCENESESEERVCVCARHAESHSLQGSGIDLRTGLATVCGNVIHDIRLPLLFLLGPQVRTIVPIIVPLYSQQLL
jgi:hypothetical protein